MPVLVDTNIFVALEEPDGPYRRRTIEALKESLRHDRLVTNAVVMSELFSGPPGKLQVKIVTDEFKLTWRDMNVEVAEQAGRAHRQYRDAGGQRARTLPDFLIGAHALVEGWSLLTRDRRVYAAYFPGLKLITPETHPQ
jgi:hypothetical protein